MYATLHVISLALILYQTQQMFKGKCNKTPHNSHKIIFFYLWKASYLQQRNNRKEYQHMLLYSVCLACGLWNSFCWGSHHQDGLSISAVICFFCCYFSIFDMDYYSSLLSPHWNHIFCCTQSFFCLRYGWCLYPVQFILFGWFAFL